MYKFLFGVLSAALLLSTTESVRACDICGCSAGTQSLGLLPQSSGNFIGLQYLGYHARSEHPDLFDKTVKEKSWQRYDNVQFSARIRLNKHFQLLAFVPALHYSNRDSITTVSRTGIGDAAVLLGYGISLPRQDNDEQFLMLTGGVKMPTGKYMPTNDALLSPASTGSGSWDLQTGLSYTRRLRNWGYNAEASFQLTTPNKQRYKFGNRSAVAVNVFRRWTKGPFTLMPQCGARMEYSLHDYDNYDRKWLNEQSGGLLIFGNAGGQLLFRSAGIRLLAYVPAFQQFASGYVRSAPRWEASLFFLF